MVLEVGMVLEVEMVPEVGMAPDLGMAPEVLRTKTSQKEEQDSSTNSKTMRLRGSISNIDDHDHFRLFLNSYYKLLPTDSKGSYPKKSHFEAMSS